MSHWNYRIVQDGEIYFITEVYYDDEGMPNGWAIDCNPVGDTDDLDSLKFTAHKIPEAVSKPVLVLRDGKFIGAVTDK